ncbi:MAG: response regulator [Magnetococcales bacterium]|nr:response regulator [Magnetococcales bacterium]
MRENKESGLMVAELPKILIVDDETANIDVLVGLLEEECKTVVAKSGEQALRRATVKPAPDLILLDIILPDIDGFEVCRRLKENPETRDIPIIFITGKESELDETRGLSVGAVDFIRKPFSPVVALARIQTHLDLQRQRRHLLELHELKNRFLAMAAHDLRNPLNSIAGLSEILLTMPLEEPEKLSFIQTIHEVSGQMLRLIRDLLDVSTIESGAFTLEKRPTHLSALVSERVALLRITAQDKGVTIREELPSMLPVSLDPDRFAQVVDNLLGNAIKFTPSHSEVTVRCGRLLGRIFLQVVDQGPGIPAGERHHLFGPFQRLSTRPTAQEGSTGLGLSIVKQIVDAHHGEIVVANLQDGGIPPSHPGPWDSHGNKARHGAIFTCFIPDGSKALSVTDSRPDFPSGQALRVLLIDDDPVLRLMYAKAFADDGFVWVGAASNGEEGVALYQALKPDVVICDIEMPVMNGFETLQCVLALDPNACVIILTSSVDQVQWSLCLAHGASYTLRKDTSFPEIRRMVMEIWKEYQTRFD